tara:strand:+ start:995 stop:1408 length:414 start_codon:yes stop_codon:yes gene_type:complete
LEFKLDERLKGDTYFIGDLPLCSVLLMNVSNFPWIILVPRSQEITELFHLSESEQINYHKETNYLLESMSEVYKSHKMNIASLGNLVPQLHTHIIVRFKDDDAWPNPVWSYKKMDKYNETQSASEIDKIRKLVDDYQ